MRAGGSRCLVKRVVREGICGRTYDSLNPHGARSPSRFRVQIKHVDPCWDLCARLVRAANKWVCTISVCNDPPTTEKSLPAIPDRGWNRERRSCTGRALAKTELEHHLIERAFENVRDVRSFNAFARPVKVSLQHSGEAMSMKTKTVL